MYQLCRTLKTNRPMSFWYFPYVFTLFALGAVIAAGDVKFYQRMWIDMRNIEGGPSSFLGSHFNDPFNVLTLSCYITALLLQDSMLVGVACRLSYGINSNLISFHWQIDLSLANDMELLAPVIILPLLAFIASTSTFHGVPCVFHRNLTLMKRSLFSPSLLHQNPAAALGQRVQLFTMFHSALLRWDLTLQWLSLLSQECYFCDAE